MSPLIFLAVLSSMTMINDPAVGHQVPAVGHPVSSVGQASSLPLSQGRLEACPTKFLPFSQLSLCLSEILPPTAKTNQLEEGLKLYQAEQFAEAIKVLQEAAQTLHSQGDKLNRAIALNYISLGSQQLGQWSLAQQAVADSLQILQASNQDNREYQSVLAQAFNTQGQLQLTLGQSEKALNSWKQATAIYHRIGDDAGVIGSQINQAQALQALGLYRRALITLTQVNQDLQKQPDSLLKATGLLSLGNALRVVGDLDKTNSKTNDIQSLGSRQVLEQSLAVAEKFQSPATVAEIYLSLGNTFFAQQKTEEAVKFYQQAARSSASPMTVLQSQLNQLHLMIDEQQWQAAQALSPEIESLLTTLPPSRKTVYARINFAQSLMKLADASRQPSATPDNKQLTAGNEQLTMDTAQILAGAVRDAKTLKDPRAQAYALGTLGGVYEQTQQWNVAQDLTQQALVLAESNEAPDIAYRWQWQLGRILKAPDNPQRNTQGAIAAYKKSVNLLKSLRSDLVAINRDVQFSFREGVEPVYRELVSLLLQSENGEPSQQNLSIARDVIESLQLAELENFFRKACLDATPVNIDQVDRTAAVIYPVMLADRLEVILSLPDKTLHHYATRLPQKDIEATVDQLRQKLVTRTTNEYRPLAKTVYNWLIRPLEPELAKSQIKNLIFVLDGSLRNVPMAALYDGQKYLVEKYNIGLTPGLQLLNPQPLIREKLRVFAAGITEARQGFDSLPAVGVEMREIKETVPTEVLLNQQFTNSTFKQQFQAFAAPVIHLATHGQFSSQAENTFILTWDGRVNVNELNSLLQSRGLNKRGSAIELLVLSACKTATGDKRAALGLAGVAVRSGARSTLASLWSVNDEATTELMGQFYKQLADTKLTKAGALRRAQLTLMKNSLFRHPYYWAPYVLIGNWL